MFVVTMMSTQLRLFPGRTVGLSARRVHGGERAKGRRKTQRPFVGRRPMHVVLHAARARVAFDA